MSQKTQLYEAMYILDSSFSDEEIAAIEERLKAGIESTSGQVDSVHEFARRRLGYEIDGHRDGIYRVMYFTGTGTVVDELKHEFGLSEDIVRGTVVVANPKMMVGKKVGVAEEVEGAEGAEGAEEFPEGEEGAEEAPTVDGAAPEEPAGDEADEVVEAVVEAEEPATDEAVEVEEVVAETEEPATDEGEQAEE